MSWGSKSTSSVGGQAAAFRTGSATRGRRAGLTMIELVVAVTILVVLMLAFATIMNQAQRVVATGQRAMRANAAAFSIISTIQSDLRRATQDGLLCITQTAPNGAPCLMLTTAGVTPSKTHPYVGTGGFTSLGLCLNTATGRDEVLFYQRWVLKRMGNPGAPTDIWFSDDLADLQVLNRAGVNDLISLGVVPAMPSNTGSGRPIRIPPDNIDSTGALWQVLAEKCRAISVTWTDGDVSSGPLRWYGVEYDYNQQSNQVAYYAESAPPLGWEDVNGPGPVEFDLDTRKNNYVYRALWTNDNQNNWPRAIKIRFRLTGEAGQQDKTYELICQIGG